MANTDTTKAGGLVYHHRPQRPTRTIIARPAGENTEIITTGLEGMDLDSVLDYLRSALGRFGAVMERGIQAWPLGHPEMPSGFLVAGIDVEDLPRLMAQAPFAITWAILAPVAGSDLTTLTGRHIVEGRW